MEKKRIALLIPHTDITLETDLQKYLPDHYTLHTQRIWLNDVSEAAEKKMVDIDFPKGIQYLKNITTFDTSVFGCTSASAVYGATGLKRIEQQLSNEFGCKSISALGAVLRQIKKLQAKRIALFTPYTDSVNQFMINSLKDFGVNIVYSNGLDLINDLDICKVEPSAIYDFIHSHKNHLKQIETDLCFVSCTNLRAMEIRKDLENMLDINVITSNYSIYQFILDHD
ncbi:maleate cis-trans isomerase family protein [Anaeromicrobium sediminis]|uniref:Asp/Glu racemase n=1 Tax=Anaeromicrobium sediminis TaxID=1478221 RepID=A0A267MLL9_9FIRM|nr:aspartate/glutamate racemase family protein [Anaeromicrobium sediminis]PAB59808.1 hypothetical protein CCE28_07580 [Anaeromicrobium sediminis]